MTSQTKLKIRHFFGRAVMAGAIALSLLTGYKAWEATKHEEAARAERMTRETSRLAERQDMMYAVLEGSVYPVAVMNQEGTVVVWNNAMEKLTGLSHEEVERDGFESIMADPAKRQQHHEGVANSFANRKSIGRLTVINCTIKNADTGEMIPVHISVRVAETSDHSRLFATARMIRDSDVSTFGKPPAERPTPK